MKFAIHNSNEGFHPRWIEHCKKEDIPYKIVNCYSSNVIEELQDCDVLLWHHHHASSKDVLFAKQLLFSLETAGIATFPNFNTGWHFDDKVGQKYLLESLNIPIIKSYVFYDKKEALNWINETKFPKVWKLRGGAGSANVELVNTKEKAILKVNKAFGKGFESYNRFSSLEETFKKYKENKTTILDVFKSLIRVFYPPKYSKIMGKEIGYVYFQDFIANNDSDYRIIVIGDRAIAIKRFARKGDFKASGSGNIQYDINLFDLNLIKQAFKATEKLNSQCCAFDFVYDKNTPLIVEISYGFAVEAYDACPGYWDSKLNFHNSKVTPQSWIIDDFITKRGNLIK